jgi:hypothetical protein
MLLCVAWARCFTFAHCGGELSFCLGVCCVDEEAGHCAVLSVLGYCATDSHRSLFSAATAHSTLHQAAVLIFTTSDFGILAVLQDQHKPNGFQLPAIPGQTWPKTWHLETERWHQACQLDQPACRPANKNFLCRACSWSRCVCSLRVQFAAKLSRFGQREILPRCPEVWGTPQTTVTH